MSHCIRFASVATILATACGPTAPPRASDGSEARPVLSAGEVAKDAAKYAGQKIAVSGVYTQGYSMGGRDGDPWALVIKDASASSDSIACVVAAKVDVPGSYPKIVAEGTLEIDPSGPGTIKLTGCTYALK
jgi:hypothetical protein